MAAKAKISSASLSDGSYMQDPILKETWGGAQEITIDDIPPPGKWYLPPLFSESKTKGQMIWIIGFNGVDTVLATFGVVGGKIRDTPHDVSPKGKKNMSEQAHSDAKGKWTKKKNKKYHLLGEKSYYIEPMLADEYKEVGVPTDAWPVAVQAKLDGMRMLARKIGVGEENKSWASDRKVDYLLEMQSRNGKYVKLADHIAISLQPLFDFLPAGSILDGEVYTHNNPQIPTQTITGLIGPNTKVRSPLILQLKYFIYDIIIPQLSYDDRFLTLVKAFVQFRASGLSNDAFEFLSYTKAYSEDDIISFNKQLEDMKYEGSIIRRLANGATSGPNFEVTQYKAGRSKGLLKYKTFKDEEGEIVGYHFTEGGDKKGAIVFDVKDPRGNIIGVSMPGDSEMWKEAATHPDDYVGKEIKYKFQNLTNDGKARFPVGVEIYRGKRSEEE